MAFKKTWYAVYRGDEFIVQGTKEECAKYLGIKKESEWWEMITTQKELNTIIYRMLNEKLKNKAKPSYEVLEQQLQAYKDKEDKLREFLENEPNDLYSTIPTKKYWVIDILQILNEGSEN